MTRAPAHSGDAADASDTAAAAVQPGVPSETGLAILSRFRELPGERLTLLRTVAEVATDCGCSLFWVGGGVRDLWLGASDLDLDLVVDGDLAPYSERVAARLGSRLHSHPQFMTAELLAPGGLRIDLARVRSESYTAPASLPRVEPGSLASDLARRDFTVNCLAIPLAPVFGESLIDPCEGLEDLSRRLLRTLHPASFLDDPTRILRGVEFEARFGFAFARETRLEAERAVAGGALSLLSAARLGEALRRALGRAESASGVLRRLRDTGWLPALCALPATGGGGASGADTAARSFGAPEYFEAAIRVRTESIPPAGEGGRWAPEAGFRLALLCLGLDLAAAERLGLARRLALPAGESDLLVQGPERVAKASAALSGSSGGQRPSAVHAVLGALADEELAVVATHGAVEKEWVRREWAELRSVRLAIGGRELMAAGVAAGPALGRALELTLQAKLDGRIGAEGELAFAVRALCTDAAADAGAAGTKEALL